MPFIEQGRRMIIKDWCIGGLDEIQPGDRCYVHYKRMVDEWKASPRWTTAHKIYKRLLEEEKPRGFQFVSTNGVLGPYEIGNMDDYAAMWLAWQVFFQLHVIPYELEKREANGDI